jgi:hypothetical protein
MAVDLAHGKSQSKRTPPTSHNVTFLAPLPSSPTTNQTEALLETPMISPVEGSATPDASPERLKQSDLLSPPVRFSLRTPSPRKQRHPSSFITPENHNTPSPPRTPGPKKDVEPPLTVRKLRAQLSFGLHYVSGKDLSSWQSEGDPPPAIIPPVNFNTPPGARRVDYDATEWKGDSGDEAEEEAEMLASVDKPRRA